MLIFCAFDSNLTSIHSTSLVTYRHKSTEVAPAPAKKPYSPFQVPISNKAEFVLARVDDLLNWGRKVTY